MTRVTFDPETLPTLPGEYRPAPTDQRTSDEMTPQERLSQAIDMAVAKSRSR